MGYRQYIGARYVPNLMDEWNATIDYEPLSVVTDSNGNSYTSKKFVPKGTPLSNRDFWMKTGNMSGSIISLQNRVFSLEKESVKTYDTVSAIPSNTEIGEIVSTRGFYSIGDGGGCTYKVIASPNERVYIEVGGLKLEPINDPVNVLSLGCKLNDSNFDNSAILNSAFNYSNDFYSPFGLLSVRNTVIVPETFKGGIHFDCNIRAYDVTGDCAVRILCWNANEIYINGVYGNRTCTCGVVLGGRNMTYYVINNTITINRINNFVIGMKLESHSGFGTSNNKFYMRRIDNCDTGILFEVLGAAESDGFISQNQFYNVWITGDGTNTKKAIVFKGLTSGDRVYSENNFFNMSGEGCGVIVEGDGIANCHFENIRLGEQGPVDLPEMINIGSNCMHNVFSSAAFWVNYTNIKDQGIGTVYHFNFRDPITRQELGNCASFRNGRFMLKGECLTAKVVNVGGESERIIDPFRSVSFIKVNRVAETVVDVTLPNNARESNYAPTLLIKLQQIGGGIRIKDVDGNVLASSNGAGGFSIQANNTYVYYVDWNHKVVIEKLV